MNRIEDGKRLHEGENVKIEVCGLRKELKGRKARVENRREKGVIGAFPR